MPYSGPNDPNLPANVLKLPAIQRRQWLHVYNSARTRGRNDGDSIHMANGVIANRKSDDLEDYLTVLEAMESEMDDKETAWAPFVDYEAKANSDSDGEYGIVEGYASVFGAKDHSGDTVIPGAFTKTLAERKNYIMYIPSHDYRIHVKDIPAVPLDIKEDSKGLHTTTKFLLNTQAGKESFAVIKAYQQAGRPLGLSYTFKAVDYDIQGKGRTLKQLDLFEYGHTALPMLDAARTIGAKSDSNSLVHSAEVDHMHAHGDTIHSHSHSHKTSGDYMGGHYGHDHTADQMKTLVVVKDEQELKDAIEEFIQNDPKSEFKSVLISRAQALSLYSVLPSEWKSTLLDLNSTKTDDLIKEFEERLGKELDEKSTTEVRSALETLNKLLGHNFIPVSTTNDEDPDSKMRREIEEMLEKMEI